MSEADPIRISHSSLQALASCGIAYSFRYLDRQRGPVPLHLLIGRAADAGITANLKSKIDSGALLHEDQIRDATATSFDAEAEKEELKIPAGESLTAALGAAKDRAIGAAVSHHLAIAPKIRPRYVQRSFEIEIPSFDAVLIGRMDIEETTGSVIDTKTSIRKPPADAAAKSEQLSLYALAKGVADGLPMIERPVALAHVVFVSEGVAAPITQWSERGPEDYRRVTARIEAAIKTIRSGAFMPANPDDWRCSSKFCEFWDRCPYAVRPHSVALSYDGSEGA